VRPHHSSRLRRLVVTAVAACSLAAGLAAPAGAAARQTASTARLDPQGVQLVDTYLRRSRHATTRAGLASANVTGKRIFTHVRGASAMYDKRSIDTLATYVVRAGLPELKANLGASLVVYNDSLGYVTKANLFELMKMSPDVLHRIRDSGTTIHVGDRPITTMAGLGTLDATPVRGHDPSERWADVGGAYSPSANVVAAGRGNASYGRYTGTILHELGHAYDAQTKASSDPRFRAILRRVGSQTDPYYAQPGDAGAQEYFADLCRSYWTGGTAKVTDDFGPEAAAWMTRTVPR
jgi:Ni/Co efflux regulator RcnB